MFLWMLRLKIVVAAAAAAEVKSVRWPRKVNLSTSSYSHVSGSVRSRDQSSIPSSAAFAFQRGRFLLSLSLSFCHTSSDHQIWINLYYSVLEFHFRTKISAQVSIDDDIPIVQSVGRCHFKIYCYAEMETLYLCMWSDRRSSSAEWTYFVAPKWPLGLYG